MTSTASFTTDAQATRRRLAALHAYYSAAVLDGDRFVCSSAAACETSAAKPGVGFYEAQGSAVGPWYDVWEDGVPTRVLVVPMETGRPRTRVSVEERTAEVQVLAQRRWRQWNPHMRGVGLALRLAFGRGLGEDEDGLHLPTPDGPIHLLDAYAMANLLLCSAVQLGTVNSRSTPVMRRNCSRHLAATIDVLEPTLVISQGATVSAPVGSVVNVTDRHSERVATCLVNGRPFVWVDLHHPTRLWSSLGHAYLHEVVAPAITTGRAVARSLVGARTASGISRRDVRRIALEAVQRELARRGMGVRPATESDPWGDLVVEGAPGGRPALIKVKAKYGGASWQASVKQGRPRSEPAVAQDRFWVLVDLRGSEPLHHVMPAWWFENDIHRAHTEYLARNGGQRKEGGDSDHHAIADRRVTQWLDKWSVLTNAATGN